MVAHPLIYAENRLAVAFWVSAGLWMVMECWVWLRERGVRGENRDRGSKAWIVASIWIGFYLGFAAMYAVPGAAFHAGALPLFWLGISLILLGVVLRFWAIHTLGRFFNTSVIIQGGHRIVTSGPYRVVRNPGYSGAMLSFAGVGLAMNNLASLGLIVACALFGYWRRITVEQQALLEHFGEPYREYMARTWALIPFVW